MMDAIRSQAPAGPLTGITHEGSAFAALLDQAF